METFKIFSNRLLLQNSRLLLVTRFCHEDSKKPTVRTSIERSEEKNEADIRRYREESLTFPAIRYWNEQAAIRKEKRLNRFPHSVTNTVDLVRGLQSVRSLPSSFTELETFVKRRFLRKQLIEQKYLPHRVEALKFDLAAAHFIVRRGGSVKFVGNPEWFGMKEKNKTLPMAYVPGMFVEAIKAENTFLLTEGLKNLTNLFYLSYLSLKNLETVNDWFLDFLSQEHSMNLKHLDISGCKNVTYRGLSCFYRFEKLEVLEVKGIPDTTEFKVACLSLYEIMPFLDIRGIDLSLPKEISPTKIEDNDVNVKE